MASNRIDGLHLQEQTLVTESDFFKQLDVQGKHRYHEKLQILGLCSDPYATTSENWESDPDLWPNVEYPDIFNYLIDSLSPHTKESLKAYKSTEAWAYFTAGYVSNVGLMKINAESCLLRAKVKHSQARSAPPLCPWVGLNYSGSIICAHCNCMAGAGEACSHIAALLYAVMAKARIQSETVCTSLPCSWLQPSLRTESQYATVRDIVFSNPSCDASPRSGSSKQRKAHPKSTSYSLDIEKRKEEFFKKLAEVNPTAGILSLLPGYSSAFDPIRHMESLPPLLTALYRPEFLNMSYNELVAESKKIFNSLSVTTEQMTHLELITRNQSKCTAWYEYRSGRVTASKMKSAASTNASNPSVSLINSICYPHKFKFQTAATSWGIAHELDARLTYEKTASLQHENLHVELTGLHIHPSYPHLGASPDGIVQCNCCTKGVLEIKCPFNAREYIISDAVKENLIDCLEKSPRGFSLKHSHSYYYQVQTQIFICEATYADFVVWTTKDCFIERIVPEYDFFIEIVEKVTDLYCNGVLPELIGKCWSKRNVLEDSPTCSSQAPITIQEPCTWCYCQLEDDEVSSDLIGCDNPQCPIQWYHIACLQLDYVPRGKWYCPDCKPQFK